MSKNQGAQKRIRPAARRIALISTLAFAATAGPLAVAPAAEAATTRGGCTLSPYQPLHVRTGTDNRKVIDYRIHVNCQAGWRLEVQQQFWEDDRGCNIISCDHDDFQGSRKHTRTFREARAFRLHSEFPLQETESGNEEIYHKIRFRAWTLDGQTDTGWSGWESSKNLSVNN